MARFMVMVAQVLEKMSVFSRCWISLIRQISKLVDIQSWCFLSKNILVIPDKTYSQILPLFYSGLVTGSSGLDAREIYYLYVLGFSGGFLSCYLDAQAQPAGALFSPA